MSMTTSSKDAGHNNEGPQNPSESNQVSLTDFVQALADGNIAEAARLLRATHPERARQLWPMRIGHLIGFVDKWQTSHSEALPDVKPWRPQRVAIVGAGTAGLVCAGNLARQGYPVTIYEGVESPGGVLRFNGAKSMLSEKVLDWETSVLKRLGVEIHCNAIVGETLKLEDLVHNMNFSAVFIAVGTGLAHSLEGGREAAPLALDEVPDHPNRKGALIVEEGKCLGDENPVDALEHARAGTASVVQSASAGKNAAATIHKTLSEEELLQAKLDEEWDAFLAWCNQEEHMAHE